MSGGQYLGTMDEWMRSQEKRMTSVERRRRRPTSGGGGGGTGGGSTTFAVQDTASLDLTLTGDPTTGYTLKGDVLTGQQGPPGTPGSKWYSGTGAPPAGLGVPGDWYLNDATGAVYEKTGPSTWTLRDNLTGPPGAPGPAGVDGPGIFVQPNPPSDLDALWVDSDEPIPPAAPPLVLTAVNGNGTIGLASVATLRSVTYSGAGRFRLYRTAAGRAADAARPSGTPYPGGLGLLYSYRAVAAESDLERPVVLAWAPGEVGYYYRVDDGPVTITMHWTL
jgi:hypothetical protein